MKRRTRWILFPLAGVLLLAGGGWAMFGNAKDETAYTTAKVGTQDLQDSVTANGEVQARTKVNVGVQVTAAIREIHVQDGQQVKAGDLLVTLDQEQYRQVLNQAELGLRIARKDLENAETTSRKLEQTYQRQEALFRQGLLSSEEHQQAKLNRDTAATTQDRGRVAVQQAEAQVALAADGLSKTVIRASMSGQITGLKAEKGETAIAGQTNLAGAVMMVISDLSEMMAELKVGELDVVRLKVDQPAEVSVDAFPGKIFQGKVLTVASGTDRPSNSNFGGGMQETQSYKVRVQLIGTKAELASLRPGMSARIAILTAEHKQALAVPLAALQEREAKGGGLGLLSGSRSVVFVPKDGKAEERTLKIGLTTRKAAEVLEGLKEAEEVITGPTTALPALSPGKAIRIQKPGIQP